MRDDRPTLDEDLTLQQGVVGTTLVTNGKKRAESWEFEEKGKSKEPNVGDLPVPDLPEGRVTGMTMLP